MSRVDDDRDAERVAQRLMQQKLVDEAKKKDKSAQDSQFAKLVGQQKEQAQRTEKDLTARSAIAHLLESAEAEAKSETGQADTKQHASDADARAFRSRMGSKSLGEKVMQHTRADGQRSQESKLASDQGRADAASSRSSDQAQAGKGQAGRAADAKAGREVMSDRAEATDKAKEGRAGDAKASGDKGELKTDADKGGQGGQQQGGSGDKKGSEVPQGFRFNPALMAPVPVAQKNPTQGSDRLRRIASEIAQKIVERVRVGTNSMGNAEFQIDLRSNVLSGLSVKVSAKNGRISAVFSGSDKDVLKMLEEQEEALKGALSSRGLTLERFKVEARG